MSNPACHDMRQSLGVYIVGALDPSERMLVDLHLAGCQECREELAGLAGRSCVFMLQDCCRNLSFCCERTSVPM